LAPILDVQIPKVLIHNNAVNSIPRVVRGGGETRRKIAIAFALPLTVALMLAQPVSAGTFLISDREGDVDFVIDSRTGEIMDVGWNTPVARAGYFDMISYQLSEVDNSYTFSMELATALPLEGGALPNGIQFAEWVMYISLEPWNWALNPVPSVFKIALTYDGSTYDGYLLDYESMASEPVLVLDHDGTTLSFSFPVNRIGDLVEDPNVDFWWSPIVLAYWSPPHTYGFHMVDLADWGEDWVAAPGQVWHSIPWPLPPAT
jgi:hypothetical protein